MCDSFVDPQPFYDACVYDLCASLPDEDYLCDSVAEYAQACRSAGGPVIEWRSHVPQCGKKNIFTLDHFCWFDIIDLMH